MPGLHLPRGPYDKLVYDFSCKKLILGESLEATCSNPHRGCSEVVRKSCNFNAVAVQLVSAASARKSYGARAASVQRLRGEGAVTGQPPCRFKRFLPPCSPKNRAFAARSARILRAMPVRGLRNDTYDMSTDYGLTIFQICITF